MQEYIIAFMPGLLLYSLGDLQQRFLNSFGITSLPTKCWIFAIIMHGPWISFFAVYCDYGITGIGMAVTITNFTATFLMIYLSQYQEKLQNALFFPDERSFYGLKEYL